MTTIKAEIFNLDNSTQLEFLEAPKTIVSIDKERFLICKQLIRDNAPDVDIAEFLNIPEQKVDYFRYKMDLFEQKMRNRKQFAKFKPTKPPKEYQKKREISSEERFRKARDLIVQNFSTNQISKLLKISERSVTRFKQRMREERRRLKSQGRIPTALDDEDDGFKFLKPEEKIKKAHELFRKNMKLSEVAEALKISERTVRRWKERLDKVAQECEGDEKTADESEAATSNLPIKDEDPSEDQQHEESSFLPPKKRKFTIDREKVEYAKELVENKLSNKDMSLLLEMSIACVRKLKTKILNGTEEELIDNDEEYYRNLETGGVQFDPLLGGIATAPIPMKPEKKAKVLLTEREGKMARLLRDSNIRTMDIAKMLNISERSVTRLLAKFRVDDDSIVYEQEIVDDVERLLAEREIAGGELEYTIETETTEIETLNIDQTEPEEVEEEEIVEEIEEALEETDPVEDEMSYEEVPMPNFGSKYKLFVSLLLMGTNVKDMAKMLDVSEKKVLKWKNRFLEHTRQEDEASDDD